MSFNKVLIANRGEIAVRVIRSARALGYQTVAVFSDPDANAPHVSLADEAVAIGGSTAADSYLRMDAILDAAQKTGAEAIHPGYGFLSENAAFVRVCNDAGVIFIGPPAEAMESMGDKASAKSKMQSVSVPTVPGYFGEDQSDDRLKKEAENVGYPLLVKAVSGGGGRGMRLVRAKGELDEAMQSARREAKSTFGNDTLMFERFIEDARHVEVQVFADSHGNVVHLFERDCSSQRRRQKVIEEAPSPIVDEAMRQKMGADAVAAAKAVGYVGAGTVEFIVDVDASKKYFFLEMNTRLQVEHPVTELVTGVDLVEWQLRVASGESLPLKQDDITLTGHAIEARLYAEDPYTGFVPQTGRIVHFRPDEVTDRKGIRIDAGVVEGDEISPFYDPMIAKVIAFGEDRNDAARRLASALDDVPLVGLRTNQRFLSDLLRSKEFIHAAINTSSLDEWFAEEEDLLTASEPTDSAWALAAAILSEAQSDWFRSAGSLKFEIDIAYGETERTLVVERATSGEFRIGDDSFNESIELLSISENRCRYTRQDATHAAFFHRGEDTLHLDMGGGLWAFNEVSAYPSDSVEDDPSRIKSPVAGTLVRVDVSKGEDVEKGDTVAVVEAMKMETRLVAASSGKVVSVNAKVSDQVEAGDVVVELQVEDEHIL